MKCNIKIIEIDSDSKIVNYSKDINLKNNTLFNTLFLIKLYNEDNFLIKPKFGIIKPKESHDINISFNKNNLNMTNTNNLITILIYKDIVNKETIQQNNIQETLIKNIRYLDKSINIPITYSSNKNLYTLKYLKEEIIKLTDQITKQEFSLIIKKQKLEFKNENIKYENYRGINLLFFAIIFFLLGYLI